MFSTHNSLLLVDFLKTLLFITVNFFLTILFLKLGSLVNRVQGNIFSSKTQDVSHIAFGSKILGPPPSSNKRTNTKVPGKVRRAKFQQHCWHFCKGRD